MEIPKKDDVVEDIVDVVQTTDKLSHVPPQFRDHLFKKGENHNPLGSKAKLPEIRAKVRNFLEQLDPKHPDRSRLQSLFAYLFKLIEDGNKQAVKAAELLLSYGYNKPASAEADLEAIAAGGVKILILPELPSQPAPPSLPVADVEFIDVKPNPHSEDGMSGK